MIGHASWDYLLMGPHWGIEKSTIGRLYNYLSDFAENWLKGVYMCLQGVHMYQDDTCELCSQWDHSLKSYKKSKCPIYVLSFNEAH